jgi:hypothetical protein
MQRKNPVPCGSVIDWFYFIKIQFIPHREHSWLPLEMALGKIFCRVRLFPLSVLFHLCSILISFYMLPLPEGQIGDA